MTDTTELPVDPIFHPTDATAVQCADAVRRGERAVIVDPAAVHAMATRIGELTIAAVQHLTGSLTAEQTMAIVDKEWRDAR